jgi:hypothetical protein
MVLIARWIHESPMFAADQARLILSISFVHEVLPILAVISDTKEASYFVSGLYVLSIQCWILYEGPAPAYTTKAANEPEDVGTFEELLALDPETVISIKIGDGPTVLTNAGKRKKAEAEQSVRDVVAA